MFRHSSSAVEPVYNNLFAEMESLMSKGWDNGRRRFGGVDAGASRFAGFGSNWGREVVKETDKAYQLKVELPGVAKDQISVERVGDRLKILAEESTETFTGKYEQMFKLPRDAAPEKIAAEAKDGILTVEVPKTVESVQKAETVKIPLN